MSRHAGTVRGTLTVPVAYQGECGCGARSPIYDNRAAADAWVDLHLLQAARAQAHRSTRQPSLEDQAEWFRHQADTCVGPEKEQWEALAHELEHRLGSDEHSEQDTIF